MNEGTRERHATDIALAHVAGELATARQKFGPFASAHEGLAVIREEYLELEEAVFWPKRAKGDVKTEAVQLAAMAIRLLTDVVYK